MKEAMLYDQSDGDVICRLCPNNCKIREERRGTCGVRENRGGKLFSLVYGKTVSINIDPIEKKPLFNFYPGTDVLSIGTIGCNLACKHCQNNSISQWPKEHPEEPIPGEFVDADSIIDVAIRHNCASIAYTYNEPTVFYEYAYDISKLAKQHDINNIFVTNGYMSREAIETISPYLDAANVDLKSFTEEDYRETRSGRLEPVLEIIKTMHKLGIWLEITTLVIPTLNDSEDGLRQIASFIGDVDPGVPWHVSAFYPAYKMKDLPPTPIDTIKKAREIGQEEGLRYVYTGNVPGDEGENTYCYECGELLIQRYGYHVMSNKIEDMRCPACNAKIDGAGL